jgi:hypothetical protein
MTPEMQKALYLAMLGSSAIAVAILDTGYWHKKWPKDQSQQGLDRFNKWRLLVWSIPILLLLKAVVL